MDAAMELAVTEVVAPGDEDDVDAPVVALLLPEETFAPELPGDVEATFDDARLAVALEEP